MSRDEFDFAFDRYDELECIAFERAMRARQPRAVVVLAAVPPPPAARCPHCGYSQGAIGHHVACLAGAA